MSNSSILDCLFEGDENGEPKWVDFLDRQQVMAVRDKYDLYKWDDFLTFCQTGRYPSE